MWMGSGWHGGRGAEEGDHAGMARNRAKLARGGGDVWADGKEAGGGGVDGQLLVPLGFSSWARTRGSGRPCATHAAADVRLVRAHRV